MEEESKELKIEQIKEGYKLTCKVTGWLDPNTSPDLVSKLDLNGVTLLYFDMTNVEYVFSAGLRAFLMLQRMLEPQGGTVKLFNVSDNIRNIFECTGFGSLLEEKNDKSL